MSAEVTGPLGADDLDRLATLPSVRLFLDRAGDVRPAVGPLDVLAAARRKFRHRRQSSRTRF